MKEQQKISIRFFDDREVRTLWDEQNPSGGFRSWILWCAYRPRRL